MKRSLILCLGSAASGALAVLLLLETPRPSRAVAAPPRSGVTDDAKADQSDLPGPRDTPDAEFTPEERRNIAVYEAVNRSVVNINTKVVRADAFMMFEIPSEGAGSGSVLDTAGHILTNNHVIDGAREIQVTLFNGQSYEATLVGKDDANDVAVLKIAAPPESLHPVRFGSSSRLRVGQRVYAIGNPFGLERTLTTGVISSLNRSLPSRRYRTIKSIIQIDAAINPGNSGGPLLDTHARLIGMNTAIASSTGQSAGVGFAIPVNTIERIVPQLIRDGRVVRADAGITRFLPTEQGLVIATMAQGGPAEKAGLKGFRIVRQRRRQGPIQYETQSVDRSQADLIVAVDGQPVRSVGEFLAAIEAKSPGDEAVLTVVRDGREVDVAIRLTADNG